MSGISEDRVAHLARIVVDGIWNDDMVDYVDDDAALRAGKKGLNEFVKSLAEVETSVNAKIASLKRGVVEGSPEWDVLYGKYFEEEMQRRGN
ncbi:MAG TPA: DUF507 family protein [Bdellovibrionales bacterium]|mgnify:CR=1 FL=1|nr:DUF507 family protein [Bdellovibrionales bacterium]